MIQAQSLRSLSVLLRYYDLFDFMRVLETKWKSWFRGCP